MRRRLPEGVRMYTGDDFNYAELIAGDGIGSAQNHRHSDALLGIFDAIAPAASAALAALAARRPRALPRDPRADGAAVAPHLPGADPLLQDRHRLPRLAERPPVALHDGRRAAERALAAALRRRCSASPTRRPAGEARARGGADEAAAGAARRRRLRRRARHARLLRRPPLAVDQHRDAARRRQARHHHRGLRAPRHPRDLAVARPGRGDRPRAHRRSWCATHGLALSGYCRGGMFPASTPPAARPRSTTTAAPSTKRRRSMPRASCWSSAACPARSPARPCTQGHRRRREQVRDGIAATLEYAREVGMPLAIEPLHPMYAADRACVNTLEQALDLCDALDPRAAALGVEGTTAPPSASRSTSITSGGTRSSRRRSPAPAGSASSPSTSATGWRRPATCSRTAA